MRHARIGVVARKAAGVEVHQAVQFEADRCLFRVAHGVAEEVEDVGRCLAVAVELLQTPDLDHRAALCKGCEGSMQKTTVRRMQAAHK